MQKEDLDRRGRRQGADAVKSLRASYAACGMDGGSGFAAAARVAGVTPGPVDISADQEIIVGVGYGQTIDKHGSRLKEVVSPTLWRSGQDSTFSARSVL